MRHFFRLEALCAVLATATAAMPALADSDTIARDKKRMDLIAGITCTYYINQGTVKFEYKPGGLLTSTVHTFVQQGAWYVENDKFCIATPGTGKVQCDKLRRTAMQSRQQAVDYISGLANSRCYD